MLSGLSEIATRYDLFLIDQWGVLHDGAAPYPGAIEALQELRAAGRPVVILSNSARRTTLGIARMDEIGIPRDLYDHLVTSGEETWRHLQDRGDPFYRRLGRRCLMFTWGGDRGLLEGLALEPVESVEEAEFILNSGTSGATLEEFEETLQAAVLRDLPMVCANSDYISVSPDGTIAICPGSVARRYEELGGHVRWHGKPDTSVYRTCLNLYPRAGRILGIGDSLHHDIAGARAAGIDSLFIAAGIHAADLGIKHGESPDETSLQALFAETGEYPDYVVPEFRW